MLLFFAKMSNFAKNTAYIYICSVLMVKRRPYGVKSGEIGHNQRSHFTLDWYVMQSYFLADETA